MSFSVMYDRSYSNRYVVPLRFMERAVVEREAVIDTACSTTLIPLKYSERHGTRHGNKATVIVGGGTYDATLYTFNDVWLGNLQIEKLSAFAAEYTGYLKNRILLGMNVLLNLNIQLKRAKNGILQFDYEPWWAVGDRKYPCGFFFAEGGTRAVYPDLLSEEIVVCE